jgi:phosphatidylinositol dimannoside acyltransferase
MRGGRPLPAGPGAGRSRPGGDPRARDRAADVASRALRAFQLGAAVGRTLPWPVARAVADAGALIGVVSSPSRRLVVERNLRRAQPGIDGLALRRATFETFRSYAHYWAESFRLPSRSPDELEAGITTDGYEHLAAAVEAGNGAIVALPHLGGWEWAGFWLTRARGVAVSVVVEPLQPPDVFEWFTSFRRSLGMDVIPLGPSAGTQVVKALKDNRVVCLLCDRDLGGGGVEVDFFGERTTLPAGPATLALRTGAPLLPTAVYDRPWGHHGVVRPPLSLTRQGRLRHDVAALTQALAVELEELIRAEPQQWHLMQPNWPSDRDAVAALDDGRNR